MEKLGIQSKHIVLCESSVPVFGLILIQGGIIQDIMIFEDEQSGKQVIDRFSK